MSKLFLFFTVLFCTACSTRKPLVTQQPSHDPLFTHKVEHNGETLSLISRWYTGSAKNWLEIKHYNPDVNVSRMQIGDIIYIPERLIKTQEAIPKSFVKAYQDKRNHQALKAHAEIKPSDSHPEVSLPSEEEITRAEPNAEWIEEDTLSVAEEDDDGIPDEFSELKIK